MDRSRIRFVAAAGLLTAGALAAVAAVAAERKDAPYQQLSVDEVEQMLGKPDVLVIDANPQDVYRKNHVPGARWWRSKPLAQLLPAQKDRAVVFYCASPH